MSFFRGLDAAKTKRRLSLAVSQQQEKREKTGPELYSFAKTLAIYNNILNKNTWLIVTIYGEYLKYLKNLVLRG